MPEVSEGLLKFSADIQNIRSAVRQVILELKQLESAASKIGGAGFGTGVPTEILPKVKVDLKSTLLTGTNELAARINLELTEEMKKAGKNLSLDLRNINIRVKKNISPSEFDTEIGKGVTKGAITFDRVTGLGSVLQGAKSLEDFKVASEVAKKGINDLQNSMIKLERAGLKTSDTYQKLTDRLKLLREFQKQANSGFNEQKSVMDLTKRSMNDQINMHEAFGAKLDEAIKKLIRYRAAFYAMRAGIMELKDTITVFSDVNYSLAQLEKVLPSIGSDVKALGRAGFDLGERFGTGAREVLKSMTVWAQMGLTQQQTLKATEAALLTVNTTGLSASEAVDALTSAMFTYGVAVEDITTVVDKWMAVQAKFPVSAQDLAKALFVTGAAAEQFGVTIDQLNGIISAVNAVTRASGKEIGNAFKTIFSKIPTSEVMKAFGDVGIAVMNSEGEFRNFFDILQDMAKVWPTLTGPMQAHIAQVTSGIRQYSKFIALMNNFALAQDAVVASQASFGAASAASQLEVQTFTKMIESLNVAYDRFKVSIGANLVKPLSSFIMAIKSILDSPFIGVITKITTALIALGGTFLILKGVSMALSFVWQKTGVTSINLFSRAIWQAATGVNALTAAEISATAATTALGVAIKAIGGWWNLILTGLSLLVAGWAAFGGEIKNFAGITEETIKDQSELIKSLKDSISAHKEEISVLERVVKEREKIANALNKASKGSGEFEKQSKLLLAKEIEISKIESSLGDIIIQNSRAMDAQKTITAQLKEETEKLKKAKEELISVEERQLTIRKDDFNAYYAKQTAVLNEKILMTSDAVNKLRTNVDELNSRGEISLSNDQSVKNLDDFNQKINKTLDDLSKSDDQRGYLTNPLKALFDLKDAATSQTKEIQNKLKILKESFTNIAGETPARDKVIAFFEEMQKKAQAANFEIINNIKDTEPKNYGDLLRKRLELLNNEISALFIRMKIESTGATDELRNQLQALETQHAKINALEIQGPPSPGSLSNFDKLFKERIENIGNVQKLQFEYEHLTDKISKMAEIAKLSGSTLVNFSEELARAQVSYINKLSDAVVDSDIKIFELQKKVSLAQAEVNKLTPGVGKDDRDKVEESFNKAIEDLKIQKNIANELKKLFDSIYGKTLEQAKFLNDIDKIRKHNLDQIVSSGENYKQITQDIANLMSSSVYDEKQILKFQESRLEGQKDLLKQQISLVQESEQEEFIRSKAKELTEEQLKILQKMSTIDISRTFQQLTTATKEFTRNLQDALGQVPEILVSGYEKRHELTQQLKEEEKVLTQARIEGDSKATQAAENKIKELRKQLKEYAAGWYEIRTIITEFLGSVSGSLFKNIADRFGQALSDIQIGGDSLGIKMGLAITGEFQKGTKDFINEYVSAETKFLQDYRVLLEWNISQLSQINLELAPSGPMSFVGSGPTDILNQPGFGNVLGPPSYLDDSKKRADAIKEAMKIGSLYFGQIVSRSIGIAGGKLGQDISGILEVVGKTAFPSAAAGLGGLGGPLMSIGTGLLGGLLGSLFSPKEEEQTVAIDRNTEAIQGLTITMKEFEKGIFWAPPSYIIPSFVMGGNIESGRPNIQNLIINVSANSPNVTSQDVANEVMRQIESTYQGDTSRQRTRGSIYI